MSEDARVRSAIERWLVGQGYEVLERPGEVAPRAAILDYPAAGEQLRRLAAETPRPAILALCPAGSVEAQVAALKRGADDLVAFPVDLDELAIKLDRALAHVALRAELAQLRGEAPALRTERVILGSGPEIRAVRRQIQKVAAAAASVLVIGETGTGKELVASTIHALSARRDQPIIKVNCAALPEPLLESELFGHERGAFTGAEQRRLGRFEEADGGTLFLDEIGDMSLRTQGKVLRALQEREFERLGGSGHIRVDVRVIAATNQDLRELIRAGGFREELLYRLNVVTIKLPTLRQRAGDIQELAEEFLREFNRSEPRPKRGFSAAAMEALRGHSWPGNVRELRNVVERAVLMGDSECVERSDLCLEAPDYEGAEGAPAVRLPPGGIDYREVEHSLILQALERAGWVQKDAAALLHMTRRKLNYRVQRLGITHPSWRKNRAGVG
ncbi:MAG: sigma-54 dependent transcriptional regulator [Myxococcota bacterium]